MIPVAVTCVIVVVAVVWEVADNCWMRRETYRLLEQWIKTHPTARGEAGKGE